MAVQPRLAEELPREDLVLPRPLRLLLTAGWNLAESVGLPVAAYAVAAWLGGRDAGLVAGLVAIWVTAAVRKVATGSVPSLLLTASLSVLMVTEPTAVFLMLSSVATVALVVAGTGASAFVVPLGPAQARVEAPLCPRLKRPGST
ncbi:MAG TPA: hypothetical protein VIK57_20550 [Streptosporangiaceae bacterium]